MSLFSKIFNSGKRDTTYTGPKPYGSLLDAAGGKDYYDMISGRAKGQGVGYGEDYANQYSNPIIKNMRANFTDYTVPQLNSELTATGRRRGSGGFQQIQQAYKEQGNQEGDIYSRLAQENERVKRAEQEAAINQMGAFNKGDYDARTIASNFYNADNNRQIQEEATRKANEAQGYQKVGQLGTSLALAPFTGGTSLAGMSGDGFDPSSYVSMLNARRAPAVTPNYAYLDKPSGFSKSASLYGQAGRVR